MYFRTEDDFDLRKIAESGQCFRWRKNGEYDYLIPYRNRQLHIRRTGSGEYTLDCTEEEFNDIWAQYFDLSLDYRKVRAMVDPASDPVLYPAAVSGQGIRILRQDPWEMLITFIISQRKNIPAIRAAVEKLCSEAGDLCVDAEGEKFNAFPTAEQIVNLPSEKLAACHLGYREKYVRAAAERVYRGDTDLEALKAMPHAEAVTELEKIYGVGIKVANCVSLYGLHHLDAFPEDVWIRRILTEKYRGAEHYPAARYTPYNGIMQQYLFEYYRNQPR